MTIDLNSEERRLLLIALTHPIMKDSIREPATPRKIRDLYRALIDKLKRDEVLHMSMQKTVRESKIIMPGEK